MDPSPDNVEDPSVSQASDTTSSLTSPAAAAEGRTTRAAAACGPLVVHPGARCSRCPRLPGGRRPRPPRRRGSLPSPAGAVAFPGHRLRGAPCRRRRRWCCSRPRRGPSSSCGCARHDLFARRRRRRLPSPTRTRSTRSFGPWGRGSRGARRRRRPCGVPAARQHPRLRPTSPIPAFVVHLVALLDSPRPRGHLPGAGRGHASRI